MAPLLPPFPGVHLAHHVALGRRNLSAYVCLGRGEGHVVWAEELAVARDADPELDHLLQRLRFGDGL